MSKKAQDQLLSTNEAAERLGIDTAMIRQLIRCGWLPAEKNGGRYFVQARTIRTFLAKLEEFRELHDRNLDSQDSSSGKVTDANTKWVTLGLVLAAIYAFLSSALQSSVAFIHSYSRTWAGWLLLFYMVIALLMLLWAWRRWPNDKQETETDEQG